MIPHGTHDPIFPPAHAEWTRAAIPGARLRLLEGMGHALDPALFGEIAGAIVSYVREASNREPP
ncbi:Hypothetical protein A7982_07154 [Minicystis rosea]|nr:Hypothetical protein A7982_07154 [Minicystis rosea]